MESTTRTGDVVARIGGDEFVIAGEADQVAALQLADRLVSAVANSTVAGANAVTASVGVAWMGADDVRDAAAVIAHADAAMFTAKRARRGTVVLAAPLMSPAV